MALQRNAGFTSAIATDPNATAAGYLTPARYNLPHVVSGATSGGIPYFDSATSEATSALLAANALMIGGGAGAAPSTTSTAAGILTFIGTPSSANLAAALTDETGSGAAVFGTGPTVSLRNAVASATTGDVTFDQTTSLLTWYDSQRARMSSRGWAAQAWPPGGPIQGAFGTAVNLVANGGTALIPIVVTGDMLFDNLNIRNTDTATQRDAEWALYVQYLNNGNSGENSINLVTGATGTFSFTPGGAASNRSSTAASAPVYLAPGYYWLALRNTSATQTFGLGTATNGALVGNVFQTKTLGSALGSTLDAVAATWTKQTAQPGAYLAGRVFGQTSSF